MGLHVYDSAGKKVGKVITLNSDLISGLVEMKIDRKKYILPFFKDRIGQCSIGNFDLVGFIYASDDCSGDKYVSYDESYFIPQWYFTEMGWMTQTPYGVRPELFTYLSYSDTSEVTCSSLSGPEDGPRESLAFPIEKSFGPDFREGLIAPFEIR